MRKALTGKTNPSTFHAFQNANKGILQRDFVPINSMFADGSPENMRVVKTFLEARGPVKKVVTPAGGKHTKLKSYLVVPTHPIGLKGTSSADRFVPLSWDHIEQIAQFGKYGPNAQGGQEPRTFHVDPNASGIGALLNPGGTNRKVAPPR